MGDFHQDINTQMPVVSKIKAYCSHEGDGYSFERTDGNIERHKFRSVKSKVVLSTQLGFDETVTAINDQMRQAASDMAAQMERGLFTTLDRVTRETGNITDMKGKPFTLEAHLDSLEQVDINFDHFGFPEFPTLVVHPQMKVAVEAEFRRLSTSSSLRERAENILRTKRDEWRARESRRRLVE